MPHVHKENRAATGQGRGPGMTAAASVMSALIPCQGQREGAELGCFPQGVPSCQPGPAPPTKAASSKPGLITPPHHRLPCKPHYPHLAKWLGPEEEPPCRWGGMVCCQREEGPGCHPTPDFLCQLLSVQPQDPAVAWHTPRGGTGWAKGGGAAGTSTPPAHHIRSLSTQAPSTCQARFEGFEVYQRTE